MSTSGSTPAVQRATRADATEVAETLGDAFRDDPLMSWLLPDAAARHRALPGYFHAVAEGLYLPHQEVYRTEGGAAMWLPPGVAAAPSLGLTLRLAWRFFWSAGFAGVRRAHALGAMLGASHPAGPHYYLHAVGVRDGHQGRGVGSALLRHVAERCDRERQPAYLENTNPRNRPLYERHGFEVVREGQAPWGGPPIWFMVREPANRADTESG